MRRMLTLLGMREDSSMQLIGFGKHPAWDDHFLLKLSAKGNYKSSLIFQRKSLADSLNQLVHILYHSGIEGNLTKEKGWPDTHPPLPLDHSFVWQDRQDIIIGRFWPSKDMSGRLSYPLVICVRSPLELAQHAWHIVPPVLVELEQACLAATSTIEVCDAFAMAHTKLKEAPKQPPQEVTPTKTPISAEALTNTLYNLANQLPDRATDQRNTIVLRVPLLAQQTAIYSVMESFDFWRSIFSRVGCGNFAFMLCPKVQTFLDVFLEQAPDKEHLFKIRFQTDAYPLHTEDTAVDAAFAVKAKELVEQLLDDKHQAPPLKLRCRQDWIKTETHVEQPVRSPRQILQTRLLCMPWKKIAAWACISAAALSLCYLGVNWFRSEPPAPTAATSPVANCEDWRRLCQAYHNWLGSFQTDLLSDVDLTEHLKSDPQFAAIVRAIEAVPGGKGFDPCVIADRPGADIRYLMSTPPRSNKQARSSESSVIWLPHGRCAPESSGRRMASTD